MAVYQWVESFDTAKGRAMLGGAPTRTDVFGDSEVLAAYPYLADVRPSSPTPRSAIVKDSTVWSRA